MNTDYENYFNMIELTNEDEKLTMISFIETLFKTTIDIINDNNREHND